MLRKLLVPSFTLLVLLALEVGASFLPLGRSARPLILIPALAMLGVLVSCFMHIGRGPAVVRLFAAAGLLWLMILLVLGSLDPLTRINYPVQGSGGP
jgi:cytochrome c oxidase subunit 4